MAADPQLIVSMSDLLERAGELVQRPQSPADVNIDEQNVKAKKQCEHDKSVAKIVPDFEDLVFRVGLDEDAPVILSSDGNRHPCGERCNTKEADEPSRYHAKTRSFEGGCDEGGTPRLRYAKMTVAFERGDQRFDIASRVFGIRKVSQRTLNELAADLQSRIHFGPHRS